MAQQPQLPLNWMNKFCNSYLSSMQRNNVSPGNFSLGSTVMKLALNRVPPGSADPKKADHTAVLQYSVRDLHDANLTWCHSGSTLKGLF